MYFKIKKTNKQIVYLPVKIDRDKWSIIDEHGLVTIVDNKASKSRREYKNSGILRQKND